MLWGFDGGAHRRAHPNVEHGFRRACCRYSVSRSRLEPCWSKVMVTAVLRAGAFVRTARRHAQRFKKPKSAPAGLLVCYMPLGHFFAAFFFAPTRLLASGPASHRWQHPHSLDLHVSPRVRRETATSVGLQISGWALTPQQRVTEHESLPPVWRRAGRRRNQFRRRDAMYVHRNRSSALRLNATKSARSRSRPRVFVARYAGLFSATTIAMKIAFITHGGAPDSARLKHKYDRSHDTFKTVRGLPRGEGPHGGLLYSRFSQQITPNVFACCWGWRYVDRSIDRRQKRSRCSALSKSDSQIAPQPTRCSSSGSPSGL